MSRLRSLTSIPKLLRLDRMARGYALDRAGSREGTLTWLLRAHDATPDDGVSTGYSLASGWLKSYPETTGYIMQTLLRHHARFGGDELLERVTRMARWEIEVASEEGGIPGAWGTDRECPVVFNTGQVLLGWAELLRHEDLPDVRDAAARAARWIMSCMDDDGHFARGVSPASEHGRLAHNTMVSWGLHELGHVLGDDEITDAAVRSCMYYAGQTTTDDAWPTAAGIDGWETDFPLTHAIGYTIQGILETGLAARHEGLVDVGRRMLRRCAALVDVDTGFLPGRIDRPWRGGRRWACLTGSAQIACCMLRLALDGRDTDLAPLAGRLVDFVIATQIPIETMAIAPWGIRGSYPFDLRGYGRATYVNWAAKFHLDALLMLHDLETS